MFSVLKLVSGRDEYRRCGNGKRANLRDNADMALLAQEAAEAEARRVRQLWTESQNLNRVFEYGVCRVCRGCFMLVGAACGVT